MKHSILLLFSIVFLVAQNSDTYAQKVAIRPKVKAHRVAPDDGGSTPPPVPLGQPFAGEWEWADGNEIFHLTLTRNSAYIFPEYPNDPPRNVVIGHFVYTRNGIVIDRSLTTGRNPFAAFGGPANNRSMEMQFYDHGTNGYGLLTLSFQANNPDVLDWVLVPEETAYRNPADRPTVQFLVPTTMTLIRQ